MNKPDFDELLTTLPASWKLSETETRVLRNETRNVSLAAAQSGLESLVRSRQSEYQPNMSAILAAIRSQTKYGDPYQSPDYVRVREQIESGEITELWWRGRPYPAAVEARAHIVLLDRQKQINHKGVLCKWDESIAVVPQSLGRDVYVQAMAEAANAKDDGMTRSPSSQVAASPEPIVEGPDEYIPF